MHHSELISFTQLCAASPFFEAALKNDWREAQEGIVRLPEDDAEAFEDFVRYLYQGKVTLDIAPEEFNSFSPAFEAYILLDKLGATRIKNQLITELIREQLLKRSAPSCPTVQIAYRTQEGSAIRRLAVDSYVWKADPSYVKETNNRKWLLMVPEFGLDIAIGYAHRLNNSAKNPFTLENRCAYHDHTAKEREEFPEKCPDEQN